MPTAPKVKLVGLMLACNHWQNGEPSGLCPKICLDSDRLILESPYFSRHLKCAIEKGRFRLGKERWWPHRRHNTWVGNWCYDEVTVEPAVAADVINFAISKGYRPEVGESELWDKIDRKEPLRAEDITRA